MKKEFINVEDALINLHLKILRQRWLKKKIIDKIKSINY
jgi:hypothetical protein